MTSTPAPIHCGFQPDAPVPQGFTFAGGRCGIKQSRPDLGIILSDRPAAAAGVFTVNRVKAACVVRNAELVPSARIRGIIVNSGNANAMTGTEGDEVNCAMALALADGIGCRAEEILTASTGSIGVPLSSQLIADGTPTLLANAEADPRPFGQAIITTDTAPKLAHTQVAEGYRLLGAAKGSGMIHPNMATTLGFVVTDVGITPDVLSTLLKEAILDTFNAISVDGDTSTNDMVIVLANGASGISIQTDAQRSEFLAALRGVLGELAKQIARDGEGASRLLKVEVRGAPSREAASALARGVTTSNLVKCSAFAGQPEWGRVASAVGQAAAAIGLDLDLGRLKVAVQGITMYDADGPRAKGHEVRRALKNDDIHWTVDLGLGDASFTAYGCDLSYDYVRINSDESKQVDPSRGRGMARAQTLASYSPKLKHQLLVEGLAYVRRFTGLRAMVYLQPTALETDPIPSLAQDLELCLDAGLKPLAVVPDAASARTIQDHMQRSGHYTAIVPPDPVTINNYLDRGFLCIMVKETRAPDAIVELALKLGIQKLIAMGASQGLTDAHGVVTRLSPDTLLAGLDRNRFETSDPDLLVLARHAATRGIPALHVVDIRVPHSVVGELFTDEGVGTLVTRQA